MLEKNLAGRARKSRVKIKLVQDVLQAVKCSAIREPFFVVVQMILMVGMHKFLICKYKVLKSEERKRINGLI